MMHQEGKSVKVYREGPNTIYVSTPQGSLGMTPREAEALARALLEAAATENVTIELWSENGGKSIGVRVQ